MTRLVWDWSKGPPPNREGETTITVNVGRRFPVRFHQARRTHCPFCGELVILAAVGQDPNLRKRNYYEANGRRHHRGCSNPTEAWLGVTLERRESL